MMTGALLAAALDLTRHGWRVFPLRPRGKEPLIEGGRGYLDATTDPEVIREWWRRWPKANIGVACAPSGLVVLDVDPRHDGDTTIHQLTTSHGRLPPTVSARTGGDGWHLVFKLPPGVLRGELGPGLDIKCNGYIVAPPSGHPSGRRYRWLDDRPPGEVEVAELPAAWLTMVCKPPTPPVPPATPRKPPPPGSGTPYGKAALERECEALATTAQGERNRRLNIAAVSLARLCAGGELAPELARPELLAAALAAGLSEFEARRTLASGWRFGCSQPPRIAPESHRPRRQGPPPPGDRDVPPELRGVA